MAESNASSQNKLSPEFASRLAQLEPQQKVQVIVLLQVKEPRNPTGKRQSSRDRQAAMQAIRESAEQSLEKIEGIIKDFEGKPLVAHPNVLGSIPIEITAAGVNAIAESDAVKAVIENQGIYPGHSRN